MTPSTTSKTPAPRSHGGAIHRGLVSLLRDDPGWLVEVLALLGEVPGDFSIEQLPTEVWPLDEELRRREIRADAVLRLWPQGVPSLVTLAKIRDGGVIGLLIEVQCTIDDMRGERWREFGSAYVTRLAGHRRSPRGPGCVNEARGRGAETKLYRDTASFRRQRDRASGACTG